MSRNAPKHRQARRPVIEEIEPRILHSADFAPALTDAPAALTPEPEQRTLDTTGEFTHAAEQQIRQHEIVFVDPATPDYRKLIDDIRAQHGERDTEVVLLDESQDGVEQISEALAQRKDIAALHLVSHGGDGVVRLGSATLNFESLLKNATQIKHWSDALTAGADLLIYGCEVAQHGDGKALIDALARLTGADVAASDDSTGAAQLGGDWDLEYRAGAIETRIAVSGAMQQSWQHLLPNNAPTDIGTGGGSISINNSSFESQSLSNGVPDTGPITGWTKTGSDTGVYDVTSGEYPTGPEGENIGFIDSGGTIWQPLSATFEASRSYTLQALVGDENGDGQDTNGWQLRLFAGTQLLGSVSNADFNPPSGTFMDAALTLSASTLATYSAYYGQALKVELYDSGTSGNAHFDNVRLTYINSTVTGSVAENAANGTAVVSALSVLDPNPSDTHTFSLTDNAGGRFQINSSTGVISVANGSLLDYESSTSHNITVRVTDNGAPALTYDENITINLLNVNEAPTITSNGGGVSASVSVIENTTAVTTVTASDSDTGAVLSYSISGGADATKFTINATTGALSFVTPPDYEAPGDSGGDNVYDVTLQVSDGSLTDTQSLAVTVTNIPMSLSPNTVAEGAASGTAVGTVTYQASNLASDSVFLGAGTPGNYTTYSSGQTFGGWTVSSGRIDLLGTSWDRSPLGGNSIDLGGAVGGSGEPGTISQTLATVSGQQYQVTFALSGQWASGSSARQLRVSFGGSSQDITISEPAGWSMTDFKWAQQTLNFTATSASTTLSFRSLDAGGEGPIVGDVQVSGAAGGYTYALTDNAGGRFAIHASTGAVTVANGTLLDYQAATGHAITVRATSGAIAREEVLTVAVTNVNDAPAVAHPIADQPATEDAPFSFTFAANTFADVDVGDTLTYSASGLPAWLSFNAATRTFSGTPANGDIGTVTITVRATDAAGAFVEDQFDLMVANAPNGTPVAVDDAYSVDEDGSLNVGWWDADWNWRKQILFDGNTFGGAQTLTDFPVLVVLNSGNIDYSQTQDQGQDLRFFDADGTELAYEIDTWNEAGTSYVWVKASQIDTSGTDTIWMYYGNAAAAAGQNPAAVWSNGYSGIYHLNDAGGTISDSSPNAYHGTPVNGAAAGAGVLGGARSFDGINDYVDLGSNRSYVDGATSVTVSAWVDSSTTTGPSVIYGSSVNGASPLDTSRITLERNGDEFQVIVRSDDATRTTVITSTGPISAGVWHYAAAVVDLLSDTILIYVDGVQQTASGALNLTVSAFPNTPSDSSVIGANEDFASTYFAGRLDELRVSDVARSAAWIRAEYLSMTDSFVSVGAAQAAPAGAGLLGNDSDPEGDALSVTLISGPANAASFTLNPDGTFSYVPVANFAGNDTFTYEVSDGSNNSNVATVTITVNPINDEPSFTHAGNQTVNEDAAPQSVAGFAVASVGGGADEAGQTFTYNVSNDNNALFSVQPTIDATGRLTYTLAANAFGSATVTVSITDSGGAANGGDNNSATQGFTITALAANDSPASGDDAASTGEDAAVTIAGPGVLGNDSDIDGGVLTVSAVQGNPPGVGVPVVLPSGALLTLNADGSFTYDPNGRFEALNVGDAATDSFTYQVSDGNGGSGAAIVTVSVNGANDAPILMVGTLTISQGGSVTLGAGAVAATDVDDAVAGLGFDVSNVQGGRFELVAAPGVAVTSFTQAAVSAGQVRFVQDGSGTAPTFDVQVSDGTLIDGPRRASIVFTPAPPVIMVPPPVPLPEPPPPPSAAEELPGPGNDNQDPPNEETSSSEDSEAALPSIWSPGRPVAAFNDLAGQGAQVQLVQVRVPLQLVMPVAPNHDATPGRAIEPALQLLDILPAQLQFTRSEPLDWSVQSAFPDESKAQEDQRDQITVLLDSVKVGGMALSVGVVWWASRISGLVGSLLASAPAWRHIDPLPVVGRDEDEEKKDWYETDRDADANELAVALVLEGSHRTKDA